MDTCPYPLPLTTEQEAELKIDCEFDNGLHPCCPGNNQVSGELGSPGTMLDSATAGAFEAMNNMDFGGMNGFGLLAAIVIGGLVGSLIRS